MLAAGCLAASLLTALAGSIPLEVLRPLGGVIRRAEDVTPERYARFVQLAWFFAAAGFLSGLAVLWHRGRVDRALRLGALELRRAWPPRWPSAAGPWIWLSLLVLAWAAWARLWRIDGPAAYDEAFSYLNYASRPWYEAISDYSTPNNHLLNTLLMHWCCRLWGQQEWAMRIPVLITGLISLPLIQRWATGLGGGRAAGLCTLAFCAASPLLIHYSNDARGYALVTLAAVTLDQCLGNLDRGTRWPAGNWCAAWLAMVGGLWAIPTMLYPLVGITAWFLLLPLVRSGWRGIATSRQRLSALFLWGISGAVATLALYAPAYVFRGLTTAADPTVRRHSLPEVFLSLPDTCGAAWQWWTAGPLPWWIWCLLLLLGIGGLHRQRCRAVRVLTPLAATFALTCLLRVVPPPRVFSFLAPWIYLLAGGGLAWLVERIPFKATRTVALASVLAGVLGLGTLYVARHPVLIDIADRRVYLAVPAAMEELQRQVALGGGRPARLLAFLPCDIPSRYYMVKFGFDLPINGLPRAGEQVWLLTRPERNPAATLGDTVIRLEALQSQLAPWQVQRTFPELVLWRSAGPATGSQGSGP